MRQQSKKVKKLLKFTNVKSYPFVQIDPNTANKQTSREKRTQINSESGHRYCHFQRVILHCMMFFPNVLPRQKTYDY